MTDDASRPPSRREALRARLLGDTAAVPTSRLARLAKGGRSAVGFGSALVAAKLRGDDALAGVDLATIEAFVGRVGELKGVAMKAGQVLGYLDPSLSDDVRALLSVLQTSAPASPWPDVEATIRAAFGARADALLAALDPRPAAVASIGQVHRATLDGVDVAVKVRHPGVDRALAADFATAGPGVALAGALLPGAGATVQDVFAEAKAALRSECDYALEAERQGRFGAIFAGDPDVVVPAVVDAWCAATVLTTKWTSGRSLDELLAADPPPATRDRIGEALFRFYVGTLYRHGLFHADPHPGNYAFPEDDTVVVYDFGCVRVFDPATTRAWARLVEAVRSDDQRVVDEALVGLGGQAPGARERGAVRTLLRGFFAPLLVPGVRAIPLDAGLAAKQVIADKRTFARIALPGKLLFLFRLRYGLYAVLHRLGARADWATLESAWAAGVDQAP